MPTGQASGLCCPEYAYELPDNFKSYLNFKRGSNFESNLEVAT